MDPDVDIAFLVLYNAIERTGRERPPLGKKGVLRVCTAKCLPEDVLLILERARAGTGRCPAGLHQRAKLKSFRIGRGEGLRDARSGPVGKHRSFRV